MPRSIVRKINSDEITDALFEHADTYEAMASYVRGHLSLRELADKIEYLRSNIETREIEVEDDTQDDPWEAA